MSRKRLDYVQGCSCNSDQRTAVGTCRTKQTLPRLPRKMAVNNHQPFLKPVRGPITRGRRKVECKMRAQLLRQFANEQYGPGLVCTCRGQGDPYFHPSRACMHPAMRLLLWHRRKRLPSLRPMYAFALNFEGRVHTLRMP